MILTLTIPFCPKLRLPSVMVLFFIAVLTVAADDWPTYRHDPQRSAISSEPLTFPLKKAWVYTPAQPPRPAWGRRLVVLNRTDYDYAPQLVVHNGLVCFGSSADNTLRALDLKTGRERWHVMADAPIRIAPQFHDGRVYFAADDGKVYCVNAADGKRVWTFSAAPWPDLFMGNQRLMSRWPCRNGVIIIKNTLYVVAGFWAPDEVFLYALDAATGKEKWVNGTLNDLNEKFNDTLSGGGHQGEFSFTFLSPEGPLLATDSILVVPQGHANPRRFHLRDGSFAGGHILGREYGEKWAEKMMEAIKKSGKLTPAPDVFARTVDALANRSSGSAGSGGTWATITDNKVYVLAMHRARKVLLNAWDVDTGKGLDTRRTYRVLPQITRKALGRRVHPGRVSVIIRGKEIIGRNAYDLILAGKTLIAGEKNTVRAELLKAGSPPLWQATVNGEARGLAVADGKLFVSTSTGEITCFVTAAEAPKNPQQIDCRPPASKTKGLIPPPTKMEKEILARVKKSSLPRGIAVVYGDADGRLAGLLTQATDLQIFVTLTDQLAVTALREKILANSNWYGTRITVLHVKPDTSLPFAHFIANVVILTKVPERPAEFYRILAPCGGLLLAPGLGKSARSLLIAGTPDDQLDLTDPDLPFLLRGQLLDTRDFNRAQPERRVKWPLQVLWFGGPNPADIGSEIYAGPPAVAYGRRFGQGETDLYAVNAYNGVVLWRRPMMGTRENLADFYGMIRQVVDVHPRKMSPAAKKVHWRIRYRRTLVADDRHILLSLGPAFLRDEAAATVLLDAKTGEQLKFAGPYLPGPVFGLDTPKKWILNMPEKTKAKAEKANPAILSTTAKEAEDDELGDLDELDGQDEKMTAESGSITMRATDNALDIELKTNDPLITKHDIWELCFDFRPPAKRYGLYGKTTFAIRIAVPMPGEKPILLQHFGTRIPRFQLSGTTVTGGTKISLHLTRRELNRYAGHGIKSFDFAATLNACNQQKEPRNPIRQRHLFGDIYDIGINVHWARIFLEKTPPGYTPSATAVVTKLPPGKLPPDWSRGRVNHAYGPDRKISGALRRHPLTGEWGPKLFRTGSGGCGGTESSATAVFSRASKPGIGIYDFADDSGLRFFGGVSWPCGSSAIAAMGLLNFKESRFRCDCAPPIRTSLALAPAERVYNEDWAVFYAQPVTSMIRMAHLNLGAFGDKRDSRKNLWLSFPRQLNHGYGYAMSPYVKRRPVPAFIPGIYTRHVPIGLLVPATINAKENGAYRFNSDIKPITGTDIPWIYASGIEGIRHLRIQTNFIKPIQVIPIKQPVRIDGTLSERCWKREADVTMPNTQTAIRLATDKKHLYIAAVRPPTFDRKGTFLPWGKSAKGEDADIRQDDALEIFLSDRNHKIVVHLGLSASGARFDARATNEKENPAWNMAWKSAAIADEKGIRQELMIPLAPLTRAGLDCTSLGINFLVNRSDTRGDAVKYQGGERRNWNLKNPSSETLYSLGAPGRQWCINFAPLGITKKAVIQQRTFTVTLHFAEPDKTAKPGSRVFDVLLQGKTVLQNLDIVKEAGAARRALVKTFPAVITEKDLELSFISKKGRPILSAIELMDNQFAGQEGKKAGKHQP